MLEIFEKIEGTGTNISYRFPRPPGSYGLSELFKVLEGK